MAKQVINIGTTANDGTGETVRSAFDKVNDNFTELYDNDAADVDSVNGQTGTVSLDSDDISEGSTNLYDQTVVLTDSYGVDTSGTYPNFTLEVSGTINQNGLASELKYWSGTQAEYDALTPDANTIYFVI